MDEYTFYHGTTEKNAIKIKNNGFEQISCIKKNDIISRNKKYHVGSLGQGVYAFAENKNNAMEFANRMNKNCNSKVVSFKLNNCDYVIDFTIAKVILLYDKFMKETDKTIQLLKKKYKNSGYNKKLDGAILDIFCLYLVNDDIMDKVDGIFKTSRNKFGKEFIYDSLIPNSIELCVKNTDVIDANSLEIEN